jgi:sec-independent protein translocase protein TatA
MFNNLGTGELIIIGILILVFFGSKKLNELARGLGESSKEFKKIQNEMQHPEVSSTDEAKPKKEVKTT